MLVFLLKFVNSSGKAIGNLVNMNEKEMDVFKQVGPIVNDVNELLNRVKRLNQQVDTSQSKITCSWKKEMNNKFFVWLII